MTKEEILIVGHGYLGACLGEALHKGGWAVAAVNRGQAIREPYPVISGDVSSRDSLVAVRAALPFAEPRCIIHCASSSRGGPEAYQAVFVDGIGLLREIFPDVPVIFTSSTSVYGQTDGSRVDEHSETAPDRETGRLLLRAESLSRATSGVVLRLAGIYGPDRSIHLKRLFDGTARIEEVAKSRFLNQIHRDDAVRAIVHLLGMERSEIAGRTFNVVDDIALTQAGCYEALAEHFGLPKPPLAPPDPNRKRGWTDKIVSNAALRATGWSPRFPSFLDAVRDDLNLVSSIRACT